MRLMNLDNDGPLCPWKWGQYTPSMYIMPREFWQTDGTTRTIESDIDDGGRVIVLCAGIVPYLFRRTGT